MKKSKININNYEAFLLDRLEGNIHPEDDLELSLFLIENNLDVTEAGDLFYFEDNESANEIKAGVDFSFLKQDASAAELEELLFDAVEGNLSEPELTKFLLLTTEDTFLARQYDAMMATRLTPDQSMVFGNKASLKKAVSFKRVYYILAAACFLGLILTFGLLFFRNGVENNVPIAQNEINHAKDIPSKADKLDKVIESVLKEQKGEEKMSTVEKIASGEDRKMEFKDHGIKSNKVVDLVRSENKLRSIDETNSITERVGSRETNIASIPRIATIGSTGVTSSQFSPIVFNRMHVSDNGSRNNAFEFMGIKEKFEDLDRKTMAIAGFFENQKNIVKSEGLMSVSKEFDEHGRPDGYSLRIAGFELSMAK